MKISYEDAGVNISEGNRAVDLIKEKVKSTYIKGVVGDFGLFSGGFSLSEFTAMNEPTLLASTDGVGTKLLIGQMMDIHNTVGIDLVAMCVNDLICQGAKPIFFLDYIATGKVEAEKIAEIVSGIADGCKEAKCALIGGETAEMPGMYKAEDYDLAGFSVGVVDRDKMITGQNIRPTDVIIGLKSTGLHSNGYSLARKIFFEELKCDTSQVLEGMKIPIGSLLLAPTKIYVRTILELMKAFELKGIANITGGGLIENVPRILPEGTEAVIQEGTWDKGELFEKIESLEIVERNELYRSFNMGIGMVIIVDSDEADNVIKFINEKTSDYAYKIGEIQKGNRECKIIEN